MSPSIDQYNLGDLLDSFFKRGNLRPMIKESISDESGPEIDQEIDGATVPGMIQVTEILQTVKDGLNQSSVSEISGWLKIIDVLFNFPDALYIFN